MAGEPLIDLDRILAPIDGSDPAGSAVPFQVREELDERRKEIDPSRFDPKDPTRPKEFKAADWSGIIDLAVDTLSRTSKDLLVAARLAEALVKLHGFAGLRDGLRVLRRLVDECWERIRPPLRDPDDPPDAPEDIERRVGPFEWLSDPIRGAAFPSTIRAVTIFEHNGDRFSWLDFHPGYGGSGEIKAKEAAAREQRAHEALLSVPGAACRAVADEVTRSVEEIEALSKVLAERFGELDPGLIEIRGALHDCATWIGHILERKDEGGGGEGDVEDDQGGETETDPPPAAPRGTPRMSRDKVYQQLADAARQLEEMEPHSPIPYLIRRAVALGAMPFPQLMRELINDAKALEEMSRGLGIKELTPPK